MIGPGEAVRYVVYAYRSQPNASCEACNWLVQGIHERREEAEAHLARLLDTGERAKVLQERDI
ncbi:MAG: hypothetical protein J0H14_06835 [Alphaproteobacteria bacterium]|nr:hypothetical protein [Alphaproteobacteria bacterium]